MMTNTERMYFNFIAGFGFKGFLLDTSNHLSDVENNLLRFVFEHKHTISYGV